MAWNNTGGAPTVEKFGYKKKISDTVDGNGHPCVQCKKDYIPRQSSAQKQKNITHALELMECWD